MVKLRPLSGKQCAVVLEKLGYSLHNITGSHRVYVQSGKPNISIPDHKEVSFGTLRQIIRKSGLTVEEFFNHT